MEEAKALGEGKQGTHIRSNQALGQWVNLVELADVLPSMEQRNGEYNIDLVDENC